LESSLYYDGPDCYAWIWPTNFGLIKINLLYNFSEAVKFSDSESGRGSNGVPPHTELQLRY